jgi:DMSO/TMAO reductase YedYZ molybdopterin-dependent catalytic subunit
VLILKITRRKFVRLSAATALVAANLPIATRIADAATLSPKKVGGLTTNANFYVTSYGGTPRLDANSWRLKISGLVENPLELSYPDIRKLPPHREELTLECISNPPDGDAIGNAQWVGARLKPILDRARVNPEAKFVVMRAADRYFTGAPLEEIMREENFLPYLMNDLPLPIEHGYPVRIFIPGKYGMKQPKWITEIEFVPAPVRGYWEQRGWSRTAWRKVNSGFFSPRPSGGVLSLFGGTVDVHGVTDFFGWALAGPSGIKRVEVSVDDGASWRDADLIENRSPYIWTVWKYRFMPKQRGTRVIRVRATDGNGASQLPEDHQAGEGLSSQARMTLNIIG